MTRRSSSTILSSVAPPLLESRTNHLRARACVALGALLFVCTLTPPVSAESPSTCGGARKFWSRVRQSPRDATCALLLRATALVGSEPARAQLLAQQARTLAPTPALRGEARLVEGHAAFLLARPLDARAQFDAARPEANHGWPATFRLSAARTMLELGQPRWALEHYRVLFLEEGVLESRVQTRAWLEAATAAMHAGDEFEIEARSYLARAETSGDPLLADWTRATRVLLVVREGQNELARELVRGLSDRDALVWLIERHEDARRDGVLTPFLPRGEGLALLAGLADARGEREAREAWQAYLDEAGTDVSARVREAAQKRVVELARGR